MAFRHGVYTSEVETALQTAPSVDSALPFVVGASVNAFEPTVVSSWRQFVTLSGITEGVHDVPGDGGWHSHSLVSFAYFWFKIAGRGDCILCGIQSADGSLTQTSVINALDGIDTIYERTRRLPSLILVPYFGTAAAVWTAMKTKAELYGGRFKALAVGDIQSSGNGFSGGALDIIDDPSDVADEKTVVSPYLALLWPYIGVGDMRFDASTAVCAVMNRVDGQNGDLPFVSPSNKNSYATGVYVLPEATIEKSLSGCKIDSSTGTSIVVNADGTAVSIGVDIEGATASSPENPAAEFEVAGGKWIAASVIAVSPFTFDVSYQERVEAPLYQSRDEVNSSLGATGIVGFLNTADGWAIWGNSTTAFPGSTDAKDYLISSRRMFNFTQNVFQVFAQSRIDNPLNRRQLEGVVNAFNQVLASYQGFGALNSASVALDDERNTTEQLIRGVVYFRIRIAPPPPMQEINGVFEFDVPGFEASLA